MYRKSIFGHGIKMGVTRPLLLRPFECTHRDNSYVHLSNHIQLLIHQSLMILGSTYDTKIHFDSHHLSTPKQHIQEWQGIVMLREKSIVNYKNTIEKTPRYKFTYHIAPMNLYIMAHRNCQICHGLCNLHLFVDNLKNLHM